MNEEEVLKNTITAEDVEDQIADVQFTKMGKKTTICLITLKNGYEIIGTSGCVDSANYSQQIGEEVALSRARNKIWELEGYILQETISGTRTKN